LVILSVNNIGRAMPASPFGRTFALVLVVVLVLDNEASLRRVDFSEELL